MISILTQKLLQTNRVVWEEKKCLRNRLRGYTCKRCVSQCISQAIRDDCDKITFTPGACTGCGICTVSCPGDSFSFEGFDLNNTLLEKTDKKHIIISCNLSKYRSENEMRLPCIGMLSPETLVFLGLREQGEVVFNISECSECINKTAVTSFVEMLRLLQKRAGHLLQTRLKAVQIAEDIMHEGMHDRRSFLFSISENVTDIIQDQFTQKKSKTQKYVGTRQVPTRTQLLRHIIQRESSRRDEIIEICTPNAKVSSSCTKCPRCTGMCPTGALKNTREKSEKKLLYDRTLCTACGLCEEFCKEKAISIQKPVFTSS